MALSKKPEDKGPIPADRLASLLKPRKAPKVNVPQPTLFQGKEKPKDLSKRYEPLPSAISEGTFVPKTMAPQKDETFESNLHNTVVSVAKNMGIEIPEKNSNFYNSIKSDVLKNKENFVVTKDQDGNNVFGYSAGFAKDIWDNFNGHTINANLGFGYIKSEDSDSRKYLENKYNKFGGTLLNRVPSTVDMPLVGNVPLGQMTGQMLLPIAQGITGAIGGGAVAGPYGAVGGFLMGAGTTFALSAPDAISIRYGQALEDSYFQARSKGKTVEESYDIAKSIAKTSAGGEAVIQTLFAGIGTPATAPSMMTGKILNQGAKKSFAKATAQFLKKNLPAPAAIGTTAAATQAILEYDKKQLGIPSETPIEDALKYGGEFALLDIAMKTIIGGASMAPKFLKSQAKRLLVSVEDKRALREMVKEGEDLGIYPPGSVNKLSSELNSFDKSMQSSPKYPGDESREAVVAGLTEKLNNLKRKQNQLDDIHKADLQPEIDDVLSRIEQAKKAEDPLSVERFDDGTPVVETKTQEYVTEISKGEVKEGLPEGGIQERAGTEEVKPVEAVSEKAAAKTDTGDSVVSSTETPVVSFADKIRKFKIDETLLTGGEQAAQMNIAGLPIAIYNASIEAIAKGVEAGGKLADLIEEQIIKLREGGYNKIDENKFRKGIGLIDKANTDGARIKAESEMGGIKSSDYTELQRLALENYNKGVRDTYDAGQRLRAEYERKTGKPSDLSDDVFEMIAADAVVNEGQAPFVAGAAKRVETPAMPKAETIITNPKEIFKQMYTAATTVSKSVTERVLGASEMISQYIKGKKGLNVPSADISRVIGRYVTNKMDTETAAEAFAENLSNIMVEAENASAISGIRKNINKVKADSKTTIATQQGTKSLDFLSPSKIRDTVNEVNPSEVLVPVSEKLKQYDELLADYRRSITGKETASKTPRQDLKNFIEQERKNYEDYIERRDLARRQKSSEKYDKLVAEKKVDPNIVSKEDFISADLNPRKVKSTEVEEAIENAELSNAEKNKLVVKGKQDQLKEMMGEKEIDSEYLEDAEFLSNVDPNQVSAGNQKLLSVIIDDMLNGEQPSRVGQIKSDVQSRQKVSELKDASIRFRNIEKVKTSGIYRKGRSVLNKIANKARLSGRVWQGDSKAYDELGLTNLFRALTIIDKETVKFRNLVIGEFDRQINRVNSESKLFAQTLSNIFSGRKATINGEVVRFKDNVITESGSRKLGIVASIINFDDVQNSINNIIESLGELSKRNEYKAEVSDRLIALQELGIISGYTKKDNFNIEDIVINDISTITKDDLISKLNTREKYALDYVINENNKIYPSLSKINRDYYGEVLDFNENYIGMSTFKTDARIDFDAIEASKTRGASKISKMRASSTFERSKTMLGRSGDGSFTHYDFDIYRNAVKKHHEDLVDIYTQESTSTMSKMFANKEFQDIIKRKYTADGSISEDNLRVFKDILSTYVDGQRKPFNVTKELEKQRASIVKFFYSRMLNRIDAAVVQYFPNTLSMFVESPTGFMQSSGILINSMYNTELNNAIKKFLSHTSQVNRATASMEAFHSSAKSISNISTVRNLKNVYSTFEDFLGTSLKAGDNLTSIQSLLTGYIKHLVNTGKIKNASEFNLIDEMNKGIDTEALAAAENFMSFINNESSTSAKAKIFREDGAGVLRMLQSFAHNSTTNFLIDLGRLTDGMSSRSDQMSSLLRMGQYFAGISLYGITAYQLNSWRKEMVANVMKSRGIIKADEDFDKSLRENKEDTWNRTWIGQGIDAVFSRQTAVTSEMLKLGASQLYEMYNKSAKGKSMDMGIDPNADRLTKEYKPFITSGAAGYGPLGSYIEEFGRFTNDLYKNVQEEDYTNMLTEEQMDGYRNLLLFTGLGLITPSRDLANWASASKKVLELGKVTQLELDAENYRVANDNTGRYSQKQKDMASNYLDNLRKKSKSDVEFNAYIKQKIEPHIENIVEKEELTNNAKSKFGDEFKNIALTLRYKADNKRKVVILNNRFFDNIKNEASRFYSGSEQSGINDEKLQFLLVNKIITPEDLAMSLKFDKNGKQRAESEFSNDRARNLFNQATYFLDRVKKGGKPTEGGKIESEANYASPQQKMKMVQQLNAEAYMSKKLKK